MKPDEWQRAMDHEAASVEDQGWARETRWISRRLSSRHLLVSFLLSLLALQVLALAAIGYAAGGASGFLEPVGGLPYGLVTSVLALGTAYLLGRARTAPLAVAAAFALFPVLTWLSSALITVPLAPGSDAVPTWALLGPSEPLALLGRVATGYFGAVTGLQAANRLSRLREKRR